MALKRTNVCRSRNVSHMFCVALTRDFVQVRRALQARNYKKGRVSQLVRLTRPVVESTEGPAGPASSSASGVGVEKDELVIRVLQEAAEDEKQNEEIRGRPEILQDQEQPEEKLCQDAELQDLPRL